MAVISFISPKGGVGKSTSALLVACELASPENPVTIIDTDPAQWIFEWSERSGPPEGMSVLPHPGEDFILNAIDEASNRSTVVIDTEGTANLTVGYAVAMSDLVIIPTQPSALDGKATAKALGLVDQQNIATRREIPTAVLLNRLRAGIRTNIQTSMVNQLQEAEIKILSTPLMERNSYRLIWEESGTLRQLPKSTYNLSGAIENIEALCQEITTLLNQSMTE